MAQPKINTNPVANSVADPGERIVEYSGAHGGGLISFRDTEGGLRVELYRHDPTVTIVVSGGCNVVVCDEHTGETLYEHDAGS